MRQPTILALAIVLQGASAAMGGVPQVDPLAGSLVVTMDIPPFSVTGASIAADQGGITRPFFGDHPDNRSAGADYEDEARSMRVGASVTGDVRTTYLNRLIESHVRDDETGHFYRTNSMVSFSGNVVFLFCDEVPACKHRIYEWRSGGDTAVSIDVTAVSTLHPTPSERMDRLPCPEPTEILQAYLQRYPSSLTLYTDSDARARQWQRDMMALELAAAQYKLADAARTPVAQLSAARLRDVASHLTEFAVKRQVVLSGPRGDKEVTRIEKWQELADRSRQLAALKAIADEYQSWWTGHGYGPIEVPPLPPALPTPAPAVPPTVALPSTLPAPTP